MTPLVPRDLLLLALPGDPQPSSGGRVFYVLATQDGEADEKLSAIWSVRPGQMPARFSSGKRDRLPRVSPDGTKLAFAGERGDGIRLYVAPLDGGEAIAIGPAFDRIDGLRWSPDSRRLAYAATTPFDPETAIIAFDERSGARHIRALPYKSDDDGLLDGRRRHLFTIACDGGEPEQWTRGDFDVLDPVWSAQGDRIAFSARIDIPEAKFFDDIFVIASAGGPLTKLTHSRGPADKPSFSHDGREVAYLGHEHGDDAGGRFNTELFIVSAEGGETRSISAACDRSVMDYIGCDTRGVGGQQAAYWSTDDAELFVPLSSEGTCGIAAFARDGSGHRLLASGERDIFAFSRGPDGTIAFPFSTPLVPCEIGLLDASGAEHVLTNSNPWLAERAIRAPRRLRPRAHDGTVLDLWILDPDERRNAPYVLQVHGGPHTAYGCAFMMEFQILASHGIGVAYGNPRGSQTYGHAYADAIVGNWGGLDASDVLAFLDALLANAPADPSRVGLAGGSYGGFMTTWLLGRSKRFAAGVSMRAVNDFVSEVGATDLGWFLEAEVGAPWDDGGRKLFEKSPMRTAHEIDVPLLVEHSERDYRCAIDQGEQLFTLLRRLGRKQTEFVRFTGDGHNLSRGGKPRNRILRLRSIVHWFVRHLRPHGIEPAPDGAGSLFAPLSTEMDGI
jgi:dipeptidyl aminopeptidase/acylaminoacyl peptidase